MFIIKLHKQTFADNKFAFHLKKFFCFQRSEKRCIIAIIFQCEKCPRRLKLIFHLLQETTENGNNIFYVKCASGKLFPHFKALWSLWSKKRWLFCQNSQLVSLIFVRFKYFIKGEKGENVNEVEWIDNWKRCFPFLSERNIYSNIEHLKKQLESFGNSSK